MESYSQNSNKLDFQHEARILNGIWLITALGLVTTAGLAWGCLLYTSQAAGDRGCRQLSTIPVDNHVY